MVPGRVLPFVKEPTGAVRVRFRKALFGVRTIIEREHVVEYRNSDQHPDSLAIRIDRTWLRESIWNVIGRSFYSEAR